MIIHPSAKAAFFDTTFDVFDLNGTRWIRGDHIRATLGVPPSTFKRLLKAHRSEFGPHMTAIIAVPTPGGAQQTRIFSPRGAARIAMLAKTERAAIFRDWVSDVLEGKETPLLPASTAIPPRTMVPSAIPQIDTTTAEALLSSLPRQVLRYRRMGLSTAEICRLTNRGATTVRRYTGLLRSVGLLGEG